MPPPSHAQCGVLGPADAVDGGGLRCCRRTHLGLLHSERRRSPSRPPACPKRDSIDRTLLHRPVTVQGTDGGDRVMQPPI